MRFLRSVFIGFWLALTICTLTACCTYIMNARFSPHYKGVDPELKPYVDEYMDFAHVFGVHFKNTVTVGITDINQGDIVGLSHTQTFFREIDIDRKFWDKSTEIAKRMLIFHELSHAYCQREHDYGIGKPYGKEEGLDGYFRKDLCPISLMYPYVISDECVKDHYGEYVQELFNRCDAY